MTTAICSAQYAAAIPRRRIVHYVIAVHARRSYASPPQQRDGKQPSSTTSIGWEPHATNLRVAPHIRQTSVPPSDEVNAHLRTLPPPLSLPIRAHASSTPVYLFRLGRAYGKFYWVGLKAAWNNHKECEPLRKSLRSYVTALRPDQHSTALRKPGKSVADDMLRALEGIFAALSQGQKDDEKRLIWTRAQFQTLARDEHDWRKLPQFAGLVALCGEYLPLLVPFMPGLVPRTCRIPRQIEGMRRKAGERRAALMKSMEGDGGGGLFADVGLGKQDRSGKSEQTCAALAKVTGHDVNLLDDRIKSTKPATLKHISTWLGLHGETWDRVGVPPPTWLLTRKVSRHLRYLMTDDTLLMNSAEGVAALSEDEVKIACDERGINVLSRSTEDLRDSLRLWLKYVHGQEKAQYGYRFERALHSSMKQ